jgi:tripartite-type tricarboxylate transporter receptor subunit TctC
MYRYIKTPARGALAASLIAGSAFALATPAAADAVSDFYKGKSISLIIGHPPGGGYNSYARTVGTHIINHIPGNPKIIIKNMPGASSLRAANYIYNSAPKDGSTMGTFSAGAVFAPLFGNKKAHYETAKFTWIGNVEKSIGTCAVWENSGIKKVDDIIGRPSIFGASGATGVLSEFPRAMNALIGTRAKVIHGYDGGTGVLLAMQRGEVQGSCAMALSTLKSVRREDWKSGRLIVIVQNGFEPSPDLKGVPHIYDYARDENDRKAMELIYGRQTLGRPVGAPPGVPADRAKALRAAFMATMKDPKFLEQAKRRKLNIEPMSGEEVDKLVIRFTSYPDEIVARASKALEIGKITKVKLKKLAGTIAKLSKKRITVKGDDGKNHVFKLHAKRSKVKIGGKDAKTNALKTGMACNFRHYGEKDLVRNITCK